MHKFEYSDENIFEHALCKIGESKLLRGNLTEEQKYTLETLKDEYARIRDYHLHGTEGKQTHHSKTATLKPHHASGEGWFHKPHDWHGPGSTLVKEYKSVDGCELLLIDSDDGEITYRAHGKKTISDIEDATMHLKDHIFREFCVQAAIICDCDDDLIEDLSDHHKDNGGAWTATWPVVSAVAEMLAKCKTVTESTHSPVVTLPAYTPAPAHPWVPTMSQIGQGVATVQQIAQAADMFRGVLATLRQ
jgi:hypothetical protein